MAVESVFVKGFWNLTFVGMEGLLCHFWKRDHFCPSKKALPTTSKIEVDPSYNVIMFDFISFVRPSPSGFSSPIASDESAGGQRRS